MTLTLYLHPLASYCHKVLIALYENGVPFEARTVDFAEEEARAALLGLWPLGKIPLLRDADADRIVPESSIIIEYVDQNYPGDSPLLPEDDAARLDARLWDRIFDYHVQSPMQSIVADRIRPPDRRDPTAAAEARAALATAYGLIERRMAGREWAAGDAFSIADCAAAPALFYAGIIEPFPPGHPHLAAYFERLVARRSVRRVLAEAEPYFHMFPFQEAIPERFRALARTVT